MNEVKSNIFQSVTKVIESAQSGYATTGLPTRSSQAQQVQALTLVVLANRQDQILLQNQNSGERITFAKEALSGEAAANLVKGDKLLLINSNSSANNRTANFSVIKAQYQQINPNNPIKSLPNNTLNKVLNELSAQWPQLNPLILKQSSPIVLNQLQIPANSVQANAIIAAVIDIANRSGQPILKFDANATVSFLGANNTINVPPASATGLRLVVALGDGTNINIDIPINNELRNKLQNGQSVKLSIDGNSTGNINGKTSSIISDVLIGKNGAKTFTSGQSLSKETLATINQALLQNLTRIRQTLSSLVSAPNSATLQNGLVIATNASNLSALGASIKQNISDGISNAVLSDAKILLNAEKNLSNQIQLSVIAKPLIIGLSSNLLTTAESQQLTKLLGAQNNQNNERNGQVDITREGSGALAIAEQKERAEQKARTEQKAIAGQDTNVASKTNALISDILKSKLITSLLKNGLDSESALKTSSLLQTAVSNELNQVLPRAENFSKLLPALMSEIAVMQKKAGPELKALLHSISQHITQINAAAPTSQPSTFINDLSSEQTNEDFISTIEADKIKSLLGSHQLAGYSQNTSSGDVNIRPQNNMVNALVTMLQASLQAKLISQSPHLNLQSLSKLQQTMLSGIGPMDARLQTGQAKNKTVLGLKASQNHTKLLQDINRVDPRGNLIGELNKVLSQHSLHKLRSMEASLQGQDTFYYTLPNVFSPQQKDIELVIRRYQEAPEKEQVDTQQSWQLNMKLEIGEQGDVLAKVKLINNSLDLHLYASNQNLKNKVMDYLPYLENRFTTLGLITKPKCYVGKIPDTLHKNDFQVVQAYV